MYKIQKRDKEKLIEEIKYLKEINIEKKRITKQLNDTLTELVRKGESLTNYVVWINEKCKLFVDTPYAIKLEYKDLKKEGYAEDTVYVILKNGKEAEENISEQNKLK